MANQVLLISEEEVLQTLTMAETLDAVETAFREKTFGRTQMPPKVYVTIPKYNGDFRVMPSYLESIDAAGVKVVNVHPDNPKLYGKPTVMGTIVLIDPRTGAPLAILSGTHITSMRTGAASGLATKHLARKGAKVLGLVGTGAQARTQLQAINQVLHLDEVRAYDASPAVLSRFIDETKKEYALKLSPCRNVEECVRQSDVITVAVPTTHPIINDDWVAKGTHINAIGADAQGKQELDPLILKRAKIVIDDPEQAIHSGEINVPFSQGLLSEKDLYAELGEIIVGQKPGRVRDDEVTVFVSTGLSLQDISTAATVFAKVKALNLGRWVTL